MKKLLSLSLAAIMCLSLTCCGNADDTPADVVTTGGETTGAEEQTTELTDALPADLIYDGEDVAFYSNCYSADFSPIFVEELNGEILNDARYMTERNVEERLNVTITETLGPSSVDSFDGEMKNLIMAGDTTYDIFTNMDRFMIADTTSGMFYATSDLPYVNLDAAYWNPDATSRFSVGNKIYYTLSSFNIYSYSNTNVIYMNLDIADSLGVTGLYDSVRDGVWTYDLMEKYASEAYSDLNGNGEVDDADQFGYTVQIGKNSWINAVVGAGCFDEIMHKDADDYFVYEISEKLNTVLEDIYVFYHQTPYSYTAADHAFADVATLFHEARLSHMSTYRDIEFDFSVLPIPKYDDGQSSYYCRTYDTFFTMVPVTSTRTDLCGAVLEYLSACAYRDLLPAYINDTLQVKLVRDDDSAEMIQLILNTRTISIAEAYMFSTYGNHNMHENYMKRANASPVSYLESLKEKTISEIDNFNTYFHNVNDA